MRILVTSSRDWDDEMAVANALIEAARDITLSNGAFTRVTVVHGACPTGGDDIAHRWALGWGWEVDPHPADWGRYGRFYAGTIRNQEMVQRGAAVCLAFVNPCVKKRCWTPGVHGSHGATNCADLSDLAGIPTRRFYDKRKETQWLKTSS